MTVRLSALLNIDVDLRTLTNGWLKSVVENEQPGCDVTFLNCGFQIFYSVEYLIA